MISVATGKELKGTGVWSFIKVEPSPASRAGIAATLAAIALVASNPGLVTALTSDTSVNTF